MRFRLALVALVALSAAGYTLWHAQQQRELANLRRETWEERQRIDATDEKLDAMIELPAGPLTLGDFVTLVRDQTGLDIVYDIDPADIPPGQPPFTEQSFAAKRLQIASRRLPLRSALRVGLPEYLRAVPGDGCVILCTWTPYDRRSNRRTTEVYPLPQPEWAAAETNEYHWQNIVSNLPGLDSIWDDAGGPGHIEAVPGALVIATTSDVHRKLRRFFARIEALESPPKSYQPVLLSDPRSQTDQRVLDALNEPSNLDCVAMPFCDVINLLSERHRIPIVVNLKKLEESEIPKDSPVTKKIHNHSLRTVLRSVLEELELTYFIEDGTLMIWTPEDDGPGGYECVVAYPVHDILNRSTSQRDEESLRSLLTTMVSPVYWPSTYSGPTPIEGSPEGWMIIRQTLDEHEQCERLLAELREALTLEVSPPIFSIPDRQRSESIRAALDREIAIDYLNTPLNQVPERLASHLHVPVLLDVEALRIKEMPLDRTIIVRLPPAPARDQLELFLDPLAMSWIVRDETLVLTTTGVDKSSDDSLIRVYDTRALLDPEIGGLSADGLLSAMRCVLSPGDADLFRDLLVVRNIEPVHRKVEQLLRQLERIYPPPTSDERSLPSVVPISPNEQESRIERLLDAPVKCKFEQTPLEEAIRQLAGQHQIPVMFDQDIIDAREHALVGCDSVTLSSDDLTLGEALERILTPPSGCLPLAYEVRKHVLYIDWNDFRPMRRYRLYRIDDALKSAKELQAMMEDVTAKSPFPDFGGTDPEESVFQIGSEWLCLRAPIVVHQQVEDVLDFKRTGVRPPRMVRREAWLKGMAADGGSPTDEPNGKEVP